MAVSRKRGSGLRRGRPPLPKGLGKRASFNTRLRDEVKVRLEQAAVVAGRSLSEEIEHRLERSLSDEDMRFQAFGGATRYFEAQMLASAVTAVENQTGQGWRSDRRTYREVKAVIAGILDALAPETPLRDVGEPAPTIGPQMVTDFRAWLLSEGRADGVPDEFSKKG